MWFPSTQTNFALRRLPWVGITLGLLCSLAFVSIPRDLPGPDFRVSDVLGDAASYWRLHAYLDPTPELVERVESEIEIHRRQLILSAIRELGWRSMPPNSGTRAIERAELDRLISETLAPNEPRNPLPEQHAFRRYGFSPATPSALGALTHMFLHADWLHFLSSVALLFFLCASLEDRWGRSATTLFVLLSGLFSAGLHALVESGSQMTWIGVAGPVAALFGVFAMGHRTGQVRIVALWPSRAGMQLTPFTISALAVGAVWASVNLAQIFWLEAIGVRADFSFSVPLGGLLFGVLAGLIVRATGFESPYAGSELDARLRASSVRASIDEAMVARDMGDLDRAFYLFREEMAHDPDDASLISHFWEVAVATERAADAGPAMSRLVSLKLRQREFAGACESWLDLMRALPQTRLSPDALLRLVPHLLESGHRKPALFALHQCIHFPDDETHAKLDLGIVLRVLDAAEHLDPGIALIAARRALALSELHESKRSRILQLIRRLDPESRPVSDSPIQTSPSMALDSVSSLDSRDLARREDPHAESEPIAREVQRQDSALEPAREDLFNEAGELDLPEGWETQPPEYLGGLLPSEDPADENLFDLPTESEVPDPGLTISPYANAQPPLVERPHPVPVAAEIDLSELPRFDRINAIETTPVELAETALYLQLSDGRRAKVPYSEIQAIAVAALRDLASKPVVIVDLLLNWTELGEAPLRSLRLRSDRFDPRKIVAEGESPSESLRIFLQELAQRSGALLLPSADAAIGRPFRVYKFLRGYQRRVLKVDC